jgi:hypothetical protein
MIDGRADERGRTPEDDASDWMALSLEPGKPWLIWQLTRRGLGGELLPMLMAMLHAHRCGMTFRLASRGWNLAVRHGWEDWFEPFAPAHNLLVLRRGWMKKPSHPLARLLSRAAACGLLGPADSRLTHDVFTTAWSTALNNERFTVPELGCDGNPAEVCQVLMRMVWRLKPVAREEIHGLLAPLDLAAAPYAAIHVRRGDKHKEAATTELTAYLDALAQHRPNLRRVFVATDDFAVVRELRHLRPDWEWLTLADESRGGHQQRQFNRKRASVRRREILEILADVEALRAGAFFIGTWSSNLGRIVGLLKGLRDCAGVDGEFQMVVDNGG